MYEELQTILILIGVVVDRVAVPPSDSDSYAIVQVLPVT